MRSPDRVLAEHAALRSLVDEGELAEFRWMKDSGGDLRVEATLNIYGASQPVEVHFPERYPGECPAVRPVPYGTRLSSHQFGGDGVLCLELGPDNWHNRFMAADLLHSAWTLIRLELVNAIAPIPIPSRHVDSLGARVRQRWVRLVASQSVLAGVRSAGEHVQEVQVVSNWEADALVFWIRGGQLGLPDTVIPPTIAQLPDTKAWIVPWLNADSEPTYEPAEIRTAMGAAGVDPDVAAAAAGLLLFTGGADVWPRYLPSTNSAMAAGVAIIPTDEEGGVKRRLENLTEGRPEPTVALIGLGSLGSKVAASLARSGVRKFVLVDGDVFRPENVVRHDLDLRFSGAMKVEAVAERIRRLANTPVEITARWHDIADTTNPAIHSETAAAVADADVVIDATANPDAFNYLADLVSERQGKLAWAEVYGGGLGGHVGYAAAGMTPCPFCVRQAFLSHAAEWPAAPARAQAPYAGMDGEATTLVASDDAVTVIAGALASIANRLLAGNLEGCAPVTLIGLRPGWIFDHAFDCRVLKVRSDDFSCPRCWTVPTTSDPEDAAAVARLLGES